MNPFVEVAATLYNKWQRWPGQHRAFASATFKWGGSIFLIWLVSQGADLSEVWRYMQAVGAERFIIAIMLLNVAIILNILRLRLYYRREGVEVPFWLLIRLTYASLGYNLLLPGGVIGDAYKIMALKHRIGLPLRQSTKLHLQHRANGLFALMLITSILFALLPLAEEFSLFQRLAPALAAAIVCTAYFTLSPLLLREKIPTALQALPYSATGHIFTMAAAAVIIVALVEEITVFFYIFLIMVSAVITLIPISIGGLGLREITFLWGSQWLGAMSGIALDPEIGVAIALCFFAINAITACIGLLWVNAIPQKEAVD